MSDFFHISHLFRIQRHLDQFDRPDRLARVGKQDMMTLRKSV